MTFKVKAKRIHAPANSSSTTVESVPEFMVQADSIGSAAIIAIDILGRGYFRLHFDSIEKC
tara:strand:+ start:315 stop:497 length:183 start_codon:yes stop_codon:yes gene_type:complete